MTRTREGENFFFSQADFSRQPVKCAEQSIQFALGGKKILVNFLGFLVGKPLNFLNHCVCLHDGNLPAEIHKAKLKKRRDASPPNAMSWIIRESLLPILNGARRS
jgi:hypothetical protein